MLRPSLGGPLVALMLAGGCVGVVTNPTEQAAPFASSTTSDAAVPDGPTAFLDHPSLPSSFDDRYTTLKTEADVARLRASLIDTIWPSRGLPTSMPEVSDRTVDEVGVAIPAGLTNLAPSVLQFDFPTLNPMPPNGTAGGTGMAFLLTPRQAPRHRVVILNTGHVTSFDETEQGTNMHKVVQTLLTENYSVLLMYLPHFTPSDGTGVNGGPGSHDLMFSDGVDAGSADEQRDAANYRYFFEPTIVAMNYLSSDAAPGGAFTDIALAGLSGGGWTTAMVAALDTRPRLSVSVAGILPGYIEAETTMDAEQFVRSRLGVGDADLHVLGADGTALNGAPRRQTHVLNRNDDCCFGEREYSDRDGGIGTWQSSLRLLEGNVRGALFDMGSVGRYRLEVDEMAPHHMISANSLQNILLAELDDDRKLVGAAESNAAMFYRGANGHLLRRTFPIGGGSSETDTGVAIAGVAAVVEGGPNTIDVFARDSTTGGGQPNLIHYALPPGQTAWVRETLPAFLMSDPGVIAAAGTYDVVALASDGALYHLSSDAPGAELVSLGTFVGPPAVVRFQGSAHVFVRGADLSVYHFSKTGSSWATQPLPIVLSGFPSAAVCGERICVAGLGTDSTASVGTIDATGAWSGWARLAATAPLRGTPSLGASSAGVPLYVSTDQGTLGRFLQPVSGGAWTFTDLGDATVASPTAIQVSGGAVISGGQSGALWFHRERTSTLGGWFD